MNALLHAERPSSPIRSCPPCASSSAATWRKRNRLTSSKTGKAISGPYTSLHPLAFPYASECKIADLRGSVPLSVHHLHPPGEQTAPPEPLRHREPARGGESGVEKPLARRGSAPGLLPGASVL